MSLSHASNSIDGDGWWEEWIISPPVNDDDDDRNNAGRTSNDLRKLHISCSRDFFNESDHMSKERFFRMCCFTWMQDFLRIIDDSDSSNSISNLTCNTPQLLWKMLKKIYIAGTQESSGIIKWILPDPSAMAAVKLTDSDSNGYDYDDTDTDTNVNIKYTARLMDFWREFFQSYEEGLSVSSHQSAADENCKRPSKRRRLGLGRSSSVGFTGLLKGRYKLPVVYLLISLLKETGAATDWEGLRALAHELPSIFKTFAENDIRAGLAMVGLADIGTGKPMPGLSTSILFTAYLSRIE